MATIENTKNTDFLRFSAYSFKDMITRKLSENTKFTDQIFEGSNLAILIDLVSYLFQGLTYCINNAASESMFSDTQIYQNINRLVRLIGYNPKGFIPSTASFEFTVEQDDDDLYIPQYAAVDTGKDDSRGKRIYYSFVECYDLAGGTNEVVLTNGKWKLYPTIFTASGTNYETFELAGVRSDIDKYQYVAYKYIDVYVQRNGEFLKFKGLTDEIFLDSTSKYSTASGKDDPIDIYKNTDADRYFSIRLNQNKTYEIKFGNDNNGQKLQPNDQVYVFYLESNGFDATLNIGDVKNATITDPCTVLGVTEDFFYRKIIHSDQDYSYPITDDDISRVNYIMSSVTSMSNTSPSTKASAEETVTEIRNVAPDYYKLGNRLITKSDFEYYVKNKFKDNVIDVKCQNNWDYVSTFYGWLYRLGKAGHRIDILPSHISDGSYYINQKSLIKYDYYYADPADQNNVYLWVKMENDNAIQKQQLDVDLQSIKVMTAEMVFVSPITYKFALCAAPFERAMKYLVEDAIFDENRETYLEITISDNSLFSNAAVKNQINQIFMDFFNEYGMRIGQVVDVNAILKRIYAINGVQRVRTVFSSDETNADGSKVFPDMFVDGISFATWSADVIDIGDDLVTGTTNRSLEDFQFPSLYNASIADRIKVIKKSFSNNSTVQY